MLSDGSLFALPPGVDFPAELVRGLIERSAGDPPEAMARLQLYLNSGRMLRRVREEFARHGARYLPRMRLVSDLGRDPLAGLPLAVSPLARVLELTRLVDGLTAAMPDFEAGSSHFALAQSLMRLMAEMQSEGVVPADLGKIEIAESHAEHWRRSLEFLMIVARYFEDDAELDAEARQRRVVEALAARWAEDPPETPIVVAGSTGSRGATAAFMRAVAGLPRGMVVLPGFEFDMSPEVWDSLRAGRIPLEDHPQYRYRALLDLMALDRDAVAPWSRVAPAAADRNRVVSLALRPPPVTDQWRAEGGRLPDLPATMADVTLIEARDPRHEALALALVLRDAAETGVKAALITPDRLLARRVSAALDRWGILPDDSAGQPLHLSAPGRLLRHVATMRGRPVGIADLLTLLKHPICATGSGTRGDHLRLTRDLELSLRRYGPAYPDLPALSAWAERRPEERTAWAAWVGSVIAGFAAGTAPLADACADHLNLTAQIAAGPGGEVEESELWKAAAGREARRLMEDLTRAAPHGTEVSPAAYADLVTRHLQSGLVRTEAGAHPGIAIWGTLEARAQGAELVICGGLNEGSWPEPPAPDPWLSRQMRIQAGLLLPERQIGLSAHDFQQAIAAPQVVLSRARRDAEAETVPSRWLNRIVNLIEGLPDRHGPEALMQMRARGQAWLTLAEALETPRVTLPPAKRPAPRPSVSIRPKNISVTAVQTLIRNPYEIYAKRVLRLNLLDPLRPEPDPRLRGQILHSIVERFTRDQPEEEPLDEAQARLMAVTEAVLEAEVPWPSTRRIWRARIARIAERFCQDEAARRRDGVPVILEQKLTVPLAGPFSVTAQPDRIDRRHDGGVTIYDYKSGKPPSEANVLSFNKQLLLEAAMVAHGMVPDVPADPTPRMVYVQLGGEGAATRINGVDPRSGRSETPDEAWTRLAELMARYDHPDQGYTARRAMLKTTDRSDYDLLSRFGEWDLTDPADPEDMA